jgi:hypothetical protein
MQICFIVSDVGMRNGGETAARLDRNNEVAFDSDPKNGAFVRFSNSIRF